jgi:hypothetical protein
VYLHTATYIVLKKKEKKHNKEVSESRMMMTKCLWNMFGMMEGRTRRSNINIMRLRMRVRTFSILVTFLTLGDILDLPQALSHLTVSRNTLHFSGNSDDFKSTNYNSYNSRRIFPLVGALDLLQDNLSSDRLILNNNNNNVKVPGFKESEVNWLHRIPHDKLLHALAGMYLKLNSVFFAYFFYLFFHMQLLINAHFILQTLN